MATECLLLSIGLPQDGDIEVSTTLVAASR